MEDVSGLLWRVLAGPLSAAVVIWLLCHKSKFYADFGPVMERQMAWIIAIIFLTGSTWFAYSAFSAVRDGAALDQVPETLARHGLAARGDKQRITRPAIK